VGAGATDQEPRGRQKWTTRAQVEEERISEEGYTASQRGVNQGRKGVQGRTRTSTDGGNGDSVINAEVAGDFYLIIIMVILMIIIILHHGADDYNHMGMQWTLQLGLHDGGY